VLTDDEFWRDPQNAIRFSNEYYRHDQPDDDDDDRATMITAMMMGEE
jgi:hypothetical protein